MLRRKIFLILVSIITPLIAGWPQPESESPYSNQAFDPVDNPEWYETPFLWVGVILFLGLLLYIRYKRGKRRMR